MKMKYLIVITLSLLIAIPQVQATNAKTIAELRTELNTLKKKKATNDANKNQTQGQINAAKNNIYSAQEEINQGKIQIEEAKKEIAKLDKDIADGEESLQKLMNSYQIAKGDNIYLEYLFESKSYADFVYRYAVIKQIVAYNKEQIDAWEAKVTYNKQLQVDLANKETELNSKIASLETNIDSLGDKLSEYTDIVMDIQDEIDSTQELLNYYIKLGCGENEDLDACVSVKGDTRFTKPLARGTITSYFGYRIDPIKGYTKFHSGVDIGGNREGTNIYSMANGMVGKIIRKASCGGNQVYVYHTINGKLYTSMYMHLLNINVSIGDKVTSQTVVGTVGGGSGTKAWERCSTGAHLHFTIATGWYGKTYVNYSTFLANTLNPKDLLNLPSKGIFWYSR